MHPSYGLAEATLLVTSAHRDAAVKTRIVSGSGLQRGVIKAPEGTGDAHEIVGCGTPIGGVSVAIVNPETRIRSTPDTIGEIWVQASSVAQGYWRRPQESHSVFEARIQSRALPARPRRGAGCEPAISGTRATMVRCISSAALRMSLLSAA